MTAIALNTYPERRRWLPHWLTSEHPLPWLAPASALMIIFGIYPLVYAIWLSLHKRNPATRLTVWDPAYNWLKALGDDRVWNALYNTFLYTGIALVIQLVLGLLIALLLDSDRKGYGVLRALMTLPLVVPPAVTAMMFLLMLDGSFGVLSRSLYAMGLLSPQYPILANSSTALAGVLLADIWQWTPFMVLIMLAGLRSLPKEPYEAAAIDGASNTQAFFRLTLPMMSKVIAIAVLIRGIDLFRIFDYVKVMTDSGPGTATETLTSYAGRVYFTGEFPYASTISLLTLIIVIIVSTVFMQVFRVKL
ncbi:MAG: carbohydrate ABC transporter permease [Parvibaculaceae bacterium]|jgi:multiple sugar transport system permease protein